MEQETNIPQNSNVDPKFITPAPLAAAGFVPVPKPPQGSGIPVPVLQPKPNRAWVVPVILVVLSIFGYFFYRILNNAPEIVFAKSLLAMSAAKNVNTSGSVVLDSSINQTLYSTLPLWDLATRNFFATGTQPQLSFTYNYSSDTNDLADKKSLTDIAYKFTDKQTPAQTVAGNLEVKAAGGRVFILLKNMPDEADPGFAATKDLWVSTPQKPQATTTAPDTQTLQSPDVSYDDFLGNFLNGLSLFKSKNQLDRFGTFNFLPNGDLNGTSYNHILVQISPQNIKDLLTQLQTSKQVNLTSEQIQQDADSFTTTTIELWSDKSNNLPKKIIFTTDVNESGQATHLTIETNFDSYSKSGDISPPEASVSQEELNAYLQKIVAISDALNNQGLALQNQGNTADAEVYLNRAIKYNINNYHSYNTLGLIYEGRGDYDGAIKLFKTALQINPQHDKAAYNLIDALFKKGDYQGSVDQGLQFISNFPQSQFLRDVRWDLGGAYRVLSQNQQAVDQWNMVIQLDPANPDNAKAYDELAGNYLQLHQSDKELASYQQSVNILLKAPKPDKNAIAAEYTNLAQGYEDTKQFDQAYAAMATALKYNPALKNDQVYQSQLNTIGMLRNMSK